VKPPGSFAGAQSLVDQHDFGLCRCREAARETACAASRGTFTPVERARKPDQENADPFGVGECRELAHHPAGISPIQKGPGVSEHPQLVADGQADADGAVVHCRGSHCRPRLSTDCDSHRLPAMSRLTRLTATSISAGRAAEPRRYFSEKAMQFRAVKGMNDILPGEVERWQRLERAFRRTVELYGYAEVRTPILESLDLFVRSTGETTEIVEKQMFELERSGERLALRPEGTPGAARAFVVSNQHAQRPVTRWYYVGPMFRAEQPQRGRYRQFHQAGCEVYGDPGPIVDAEMIDMLAKFLRSAGVPSFEVRINSLGGAASRARYRDALVRYLEPKKEALSEHARRRLGDNPLRILDSKDPRDREISAGAPSVLDELEPDDRAHFEGLCRALDALGTEYIVDGGLVRGLDYYTRTLFEFTSSIGELGSQNAILGGGRYDNMLSELGGPALPAIGFACGLERLLLALGDAPSERAPLCFVAPIGEAAKLEGLKLAGELRERGIAVELDGRGGSLKSLLRRADGLGARLCLVLGDSEIERGIIQVKDLRERGQSEIARAAVLGEVRRLLDRGEGAH